MFKNNQGRASSTRSWSKCCQPRTTKFCSKAKFRLFFCGLFLGWKSMYFSNMDMKNDETHFWMTFFTKNLQKNMVFDENHEKSMRNFIKPIFYQWYSVICSRVTCSFQNSTSIPTTPKKQFLNICKIRNFWPLWSQFFFLIFIKDSFRNYS